MKRNKIIIVIGLILAGAALLVILEGVNFPENTYLLKSIKNAGHIPLFGLMSLVVLGMSFALLNKKLPSRIWHYAVAFVVTGFLGFLSELFQKFTPRDADFWDIMRDIAGAAIFLLVWMTLDSKLRDYLKRWGKWAKPAVILLAAFVIMIVSIYPILQWGVSYKQRSENLPVLCSFENNRDASFVGSCRSQISMDKTPNEWTANTDSMAGRWEVNAGDWPQVYFEPYPDWTGYDSLAFDTYSNEDTSLTAIVRIADFTRDGAEFDRKVVIPPGQADLSIPIADIKKESRKRPLDISDIRIILIIFEKTTAPFTLYIDNLRLIK